MMWSEQYNTPIGPSESALAETIQAAYTLIVSPEYRESKYHALSNVLLSGTTVDITTHK